MENVVGNFVTCTDGRYGGFKMWRLCPSMETRLTLKYLKIIIKDKTLLSELLKKGLQCVLHNILFLFTK